MRFARDFQFAPGDNYLRAGMWAVDSDTISFDVVIEVDGQKTFGTSEFTYNGGSQFEAQINCLRSGDDPTNVLKDGTAEK